MGAYSSSGRSVSQTRSIAPEDCVLRYGGTEHDIEGEVGAGVVATAGPGGVGFDDRLSVSRVADVHDHRTGQTRTDAAQYVRTEGERVR